MNRTHPGDEPSSPSTEDPVESPPPSPIHDLAGRVVKNRLYPFARGANSHIYEGQLTWPDGRRTKVAIKMILPDRDGQSDEALRQLKREAEVWARLKHENLVPLFGVANDGSVAPWPVLVSPFYELGHIRAFLNKRPEANRQAIVLGVASGLEYLHANDVVHGDLKVQNVLMDGAGIPYICDFGISKIINRHGFTTVSVGTLPYMAPELFIAFDLKEQDICRSTTKSSDVYSFALLVLETLTSEAPKGRPFRPFMAAKDIHELRPKRADYDHEVITDEIWSILDRCWVFEPCARPAISDVLRELSFVFQVTTVSVSIA
ncbi:kinase-like domain-containing protein [Mycena vulgaris]|nr:kinase-like domain-containing protein [Mycena vulgaris]